MGDRLIAQREGTTLSYIHQDSLTSSSVMSSSTGTLISSIKYFPFGATRSGDVSTDKKFTGQRLDGTGLYYYNARYYDPEIGRFISPDPIIPDIQAPQGFNHFSYVLNSPLRYIDLTGHAAVACDEGCGVGVVQAIVGLLSQLGWDITVTPGATSTQLHIENIPGLDGFAVVDITILEPDLPLPLFPDKRGITLPGGITLSTSGWKFDDTWLMEKSYTLVMHEMYHWMAASKDTHWFLKYGFQIMFALSGKNYDEILASGFEDDISHWFNDDGDLVIMDPHTGQMIIVHEDGTVEVVDTTYPNNNL